MSCLIKYNDPELATDIFNGQSVYEGDKSWSQLNHLNARNFDKKENYY